MTGHSSTDTQAARSSFVTGVAWVFIVLSGFSTFIGALQNVMIRFMPFDELDKVIRDSTAAGRLPPSAQFMFSHFRLLVLVTFLLSLLTFITSLGLLRRRNWARFLFMALMGLGIVYMVGTLFFQNSFISSFNEQFSAAAPQDSLFRSNLDRLQSLITAMRVFMTVLSLGIAAVFAWIVLKLSSPSIRGEFTSRAA